MPSTVTVLIRNALVAALRADLVLDPVIGGRIFPGVVPESQRLPALTWQVINVSRRTNRSLDSTNPIASTRAQLTVVSKLASDCQAAGDALRQWDGFRGDFGSLGLDVIETVLIDERDFIDPPADGTGRSTYRTVFDFLFRYREPTPARLT